MRIGGEGLPDIGMQFAARVSEGHRQTRSQYDCFIEQGIVPESMQLPQLGAFALQVAALEPGYDYMNSQHWEPEVVFAPSGLSVRQWSNLYRQIEDEPRVFHVKLHGVIDSPDIVRRTPDDGKWDVSVISATRAPVINFVSSSGKVGAQARYAKGNFTALAERAAERASTIPRFSPDAPTYLALQLRLIALGRRPVDEGYASYCMSADTPPKQTLVMSYDQNAIVSGYCDHDDSGKDLGFRPTVIGRNIIRTSSK